MCTFSRKSCWVAPAFEGGSALSLRHKYVRRHASLLGAK